MFPDRRVATDTAHPISAAASSSATSPTSTSLSSCHRCPHLKSLVLPTPILPLTADDASPPVGVYRYSVDPPSPVAYVGDSPVGQVTPLADEWPPVASESDDDDSRQCLYDGVVGHYSQAGRGYPHGHGIPAAVDVRTRRSCSKTPRPCGDIRCFRQEQDEADMNAMSSC